MKTIQVVAALIIHDGRIYARSTGATLTVMPGGEHWFPTPGQMAFLDRWIQEVQSES